MKSHVIEYSDGRIIECWSRREALTILRDQYGDNIVYATRRGDLPLRDESFMVWENSEDAENDDGKNCVAEVVCENENGE